MPPEVCPHCGASVPAGARACPECGSDDQTGWSEDASKPDADLPDEEFDYDKFVKREFGSSNKAAPEGLHWIWWIAGIILVIALLVLWLA
jgi:hypothetical protein